MEKVELKKASEYCDNLVSAIEANDYTTGFSNFKNLVELYCKLGITDTMFLMMRGMPPLTTFLETSEELLKKSDSNIVKKVFTDLENNLAKKNCLNL